MTQYLPVLTVDGWDWLTVSYVSVCVVIYTVTNMSAAPTTRPAVKLHTVVVAL